MQDFFRYRMSLGGMASSGNSTFNEESIGGLSAFKNVGKSTKKMDLVSVLKFWKQVPPTEPYRVILGDVGDKLYNTRERARHLLVHEISDIPQEAVYTNMNRITGLPTEAALKVLVEKMGVPDVKAKNKIRDSYIMANYLIDSNSVKLGCCERWTKRSKRVGTLEFHRFLKSMSVTVGEPTGQNRLLVNVTPLIFVICWTRGAKMSGLDNGSKQKKKEPVI